MADRSATIFSTVNCSSSEVVRITVCFFSAIVAEIDLFRREVVDRLVLDISEREDVKRRKAKKDKGWMG